MKKLLVLGKIFFCLLFGVVLLPAQETVFQLAPPKADFSKVFFNQDTFIDLDFRLAESSIFYTLDGSKPTQNSLLYSDKIPISKSCSLRAKTFKKGFLASDTLIVTCIKTKKTPITLKGSAPKAPYQLNGLVALTDKIAGTESDFRQHWLGFQQDTLLFELSFSKMTKTKALHFSFLQKQGAWIFLPERIQILDKNGKILAEQNIDALKQDADKNTFVYLDFFRKKRVKKLLVRIYTPKKLPTWHSGAGQKPWCFFDEIWIGQNKATNHHNHRND